jgi:flagellar biosynthetic protein FliP
VKRLSGILLAISALLLFAHPVLAQALPMGTTDILNSVDLRAPLQSPGLSTPLQLIFLMAALTMLPFLLIMTTSFIRTVIVLAFLKQAMGLQNVPPGQVVIGVALFLTFFTMAPTWDVMNRTAVVPFLNHQMNQSTALSLAAAPLETFMIRQTSEQELSFFIKLAKISAPATPADVPFFVAIPAFMVSELATGFKIGFIVYLPFIVVDLVITNVIMALGMQQLQTQMIAPPFKVMIFSLANGWHLLIEALVRSFH